MNRSVVAKGVTVCAALPAIVIPAFCLVYIVASGWPVLSLEFVFTSKDADGFGGMQGIFPQLLGSLLLALGSVTVALPFAVGTAIYYHLLATQNQRRLLGAFLNMLQGIPPIVFGLFGLIVFVHLLNWGVSLASGFVILAVVILPMLVLNSIAALSRVSAEYTESAQSLGLSHGEIIRRVWLPQAWPGLVTGLLLAMARSLSETAPILFTATVFSGVIWPESIFDPVTTLQTHIFYLAQESEHEAAIQVAWGCAVVLIGSVTLFSLLARWLNMLGAKHE